MKNFLERHKKILSRILLCKVVEIFLVLLAAKFLTAFIISARAELVGVVFVTLAAKLLAASVGQKFWARLSIEVQTSLRKEVHEKFLAAEISSGEILTLMFDTLKSLDEFFLKVAPNFSAVILLPIFLVVAAVEDPLTAAILLVTLPVAPMILYLIGKATSERNARAWRELQKLNGEFRELLAAITTLKIFGRIDPAAKRLRAASEKSSAATLDVLKLAFVSSFALELLTTLSIALVAVTLGLRLVAGGVEFQAALFLLIIAPEIFLPIRKLGVAFHLVIEAKSSLDRLRNFLSQFPIESGGTVEKLKVPTEIFFDSVSFIYPRKKSPALSKLNLKFAAGKVTALVGESGSGKSTVLKLLSGLYLPASGEIFFNELPASKFRRRSLFEKIAYMPQAPHLFDAPLRENFTMLGELDSLKLPTLLKELGLPNLNLDAVQKLSRGQLQRLGVARALLKNSSLILLDEPTAGLDAASEKKVLDLLKKFSTRRTIVIATHRPAVINFADEVVQLGGLT